MTIPTILQKVKTTLQTDFDAVYPWFDLPAKQLNFRPSWGGWTIAEILEHIALTNKFLLILIEKAKKKALKNTQNRNLAEELKDYTLVVKGLDEVGLYQSFIWVRPKHMEPRGEDLSWVKKALETHLEQCFDTLEKLKNGEGLLYKTTMTVNNIGKLDVYQYLYFLAKHARRHIAQMQRNLDDFSKPK